MEVIELSDKEEWIDFVKKFRNDSEVLIYKFSPICGLSFSTDDIMNTWIELNNASSPLKIIKINVISSRSLSRSIASDLGVKHESPQVIWLNKKMSVKFHTSHYGITKEELDKHL
jgi:bacillithiol system protein YtxJ